MAYSTGRFKKNLNFKSLLLYSRHEENCCRLVAEMRKTLERQNQQKLKAALQFGARYMFRGYFVTK